ncbi:leucine-rich repeat protein [Fibrobacter sp.]|uniref:leucine-rich repeat protein n=1 Tax=Fibrobacter sp. TaxID=35828 RepID=UPI00388FC425
MDDIGIYETTDNVLLIKHRPGFDYSTAGFELTVRMKPNVHTHSITIDQQSGGTWTADAGSTAIATHDVDLTVTLDANRVLASIKVVKTDDPSTEIPLTKIEDSHYRFTMPDYDVTVVPGAYDWEWTSGNTICHLDNQGVLTVSAIAGTDGAMADYDDSNDRPWNNEFEFVNRIDVKNGVTVIGKYAFHSGLFTSAILPEGLQSIHEHAFKYCNQLTSIIIPYTVRSIAAGAFYACYGLKHIYTYALATDISWGVNPWDFMRDPQGVNPGPFTVMHVLPSQVAAYQNKQLNVSVIGDLEASGNWTTAGNYASSFSNQNGNTITIMNEAEMARFAYMVNAGQNTYRGYTIKLDRDLNMYSHEWSPIGTGSFSYQFNLTPFMGTFDGQGHTINGIIVNRSGSSYNGLFGYVGGLGGHSAYGEVKNLSLRQSRITGGNYTGGLVGYLQYGRVTNCFTDATVNGNQYVGGLVGAMEGLSSNDITAYVGKSLYMGSNVSGNQNVRAVVGYRKGSIDYCTITSYYTNKNISTKTQLDVYAVKAIDDSSEDITVTFTDKGKIVYEGDTYVVTDGSATFTVRGADPYRTLSSVAVNGNQIATAAGTFSFEICSSADVCRINATLGNAQLAGSGTEADPYRIYNMDDWNLFAELVAGGATFSGKFVKQMDQIGDQNGNPYNGITTMVGKSEELSFQGTYDGSKYYIIGSINSTDDYAAPFRFVKNATIKNVKVAGTFNVGKHGSALVGRTYGTTLIDTVWVHLASISSSRNDNGNRYMGGVVGHGGSSTLTMKNILFDADMTNDGDYTGGLLGWTDGMTLSLDSCTFRGSFSGNGKFHPIAARKSYAIMRTTANNVYFYTGPKDIENAHIAVSAIRVQNSVPTDGSYGTAVDALTGNKTSYYYNDAPQGFHIDYDIERGSAGYYFVNMQCGNMDQQVVVGSGITSFMIYDDGGKLSNACGTSTESKLTVVAPRNLLKVQGQVVSMDPLGNYLSIDDDAGHNLFHFGHGDFEDPEWADIPSATTAGHVLVVYTDDEADDYYNGFELQVTLQSDGKYHYGAVTVESDYSMATIDGSYNGAEGTVISEIVGVDTVVLDRKFTVGAFSTIMLPFDMSEHGIDVTKVHGAEFYGFSEMKYENGKWTAGATKVSGYIDANTPYLVKPTDTRITFDGPVFMNTLYGDQKTIEGNWEFQGTYQYTVFGDVKETNPQNTYYGFVARDTTVDGKQFSAGQFVKAGPRAYIYPMRAYLVHNGAGGSQKNAGGFGEFGTLPETIDLKIMDENGVVTETATLNTRTGEIKRDRWFDLQGRKLNGKPAEKGRYLHNGRVEVIK